MAFTALKSALNIYGFSLEEHNHSWLEEPPLSFAILQKFEPRAPKNGKFPLLFLQVTFCSLESWWLLPPLETQWLENQLREREELNAPDHPHFTFRVWEHQDRKGISWSQHYPGFLSEKPPCGQGTLSLLTWAAAHDKKTNKKKPVL